MLQTALTAACIFGRLKVAELLIAKGANIHGGGGGGGASSCTPLRGVVMEDFDFQPGEFISSVAVGRLALLKMLIARDDVDIEETDKNGERALSHSCSFPKGLPLAKLLIDKGAVLNAVDEYGNSALHYSSSNGILQTVRLLLENNADIDLMSKVRVPFVSIGG